MLISNKLELFIMISSCDIVPILFKLGETVGVYDNEFVDVIVGVNDTDKDTVFDISGDVETDGVI